MQIYTERPWIKMLLLEREKPVKGGGTYADSLHQGEANVLTIDLCKKNNQDSHVAF